ncbi:MAG: amidohydrolase [Sphingobacteriales bacterium]|nr:MAG: amidohydrolase [Sphingobacteriales bacterium]
MCKIDSHQHFWCFDPVKDKWITNSMFILQKDFLPADIAPILHHYGIDGCMAVQSGQTEGESLFLLNQAEQYPFIKGIVGWVDLIADNIDERLAYYSQFERMKGFRHILQGESDRAFMLRPDFKRGIGKLKQFDFTYDILINDDQLPYIHEFVAEFPEQPFVINHLAKPRIKDKQIREWQQHMEAIAKYPNVHCKVSGMVTEADWLNRKRDDFWPYLDVVFEAFGSKRVMYGSDWPVCRLAATYGEVFSIVRAYCAELSREEQRLFWGGNATEFYKLKL